MIIIIKIVSIDPPGLPMGPSGLPMAPPGLPMPPFGLPMPLTSGAASMPGVSGPVDYTIGQTDHFH